MSQPSHMVLISPEGRAALLACGNQNGVTGDLGGGLLFGYPLDQDQHLVISSIPLKSEVGFGRRDFSLDQTRTSRQLDEAQRLDPRATYSGVWYVHRTPQRELTRAESTQAQAMLEDPDFAFGELVCLVLCLYSGQATVYASCLNRHQAAHGQAPSPAELRLTTDWMFPPKTAATSPAATDSRHWYKSPEMAARLEQEHQTLAERYAMEPGLAADGQMFFRLSPRFKYQKMSFYLAVGQGFPEKAPHVYLLIGGRPQRIASPLLGSWTGQRRLVELADELVTWLAFSIDTYVEAAHNALNRQRYAEAADLLRLVLSIEPRTPNAARMLARAEAPLVSAALRRADHAHLAVA
jgi:hypothetical protein